MEQIVKEVKMELEELSKEELQSISGGSFWEVMFINGHLYYVFHLE